MIRLPLPASLAPQSATHGEHRGRQIGVTLLSLVLASLAAPGVARGFSIATVGNDAIVRWTSTKIPFTLHQAGTADVGDGSDLEALRKGFADWQAVPCGTAIRFIDQGTTTNRKVTSTGGGTNGVNELVWIENNQWVFGAYVLGVTAPLFNYTGRIVEADIAFNGRNHTWSTKGKTGTFSNTQDVLNVAIHEEGHFFGLQHVLDFDQFNPVTMAPAADPYLRTRTLEADDRMGICFLYPESPPWTCTTDEDCPDVVDQQSNGQEFYKVRARCAGGSCKVGYAPGPNCGTGQIGDACTGKASCLCELFCQDTGAARICSRKCDPSADDCPDDFACFPYTEGGNEGACLPGECRPAGRACTKAATCCTGLCVGISAEDFACREPCEMADPRCPQGEVCYPVASGGSRGACMASPKEVGDACATAAECRSGVCVALPGTSDFRCRRSCDPGGAEAACAPDQRCLKVAGGQGACLATGDTQTGSDSGPASRPDAAGADEGSADAAGATDTTGTPPATGGSGGGGCSAARAPSAPVAWILLALLALLCGLGAARRARQATRGGGAPAQSG